MLASQAFVTLRLRHAVVYAIGLTGAWLLLFWYARATAAAIQLGLGMLGVAIFSVVLRRYGEQTARAEALLAELRAANAELAAARERAEQLGGDFSAGPGEDGGFALELALPA
jgi:hypothetical protein